MKRLIVQLLVASCAFVAIAYTAMFVTSVPPRWAPLSLALGANGVIMSLMALGAVRRDTLPRSLVCTFIGLFVLCAGCFVVALLLPAQEGMGGVLVLGLPLRTAIVLYGVGVVPIAILPFAYALTFESSTLSDEDLVRIRAAHAGMRTGGEA